MLKAKLNGEIIELHLDMKGAALVKSAMHKEIDRMMDDTRFETIPELKAFFETVTQIHDELSAVINHIKTEGAK